MSEAPFGNAQLGLPEGDSFEVLGVVRLRALQATERCPTLVTPGHR